MTHICTLTEKEKALVEEQRKLWLGESGVGRGSEEEKQLSFLPPQNEIPTCKIHNRPMIYHPKGHSKATGKPYNAFWACPVRDKLGYCTQTSKQEKPLAAKYQPFS